MIAALVSADPTSTLADEPLAGADSETLAREPQQSPEQLGDGTLDGLQFADPTEGLSLIDPPTAANDGGAHLSYPLTIPAGRGLTPELSLDYDSGGGNGWLGQGWDLSVGEIAVDTRYGAPYFDPTLESESYTIDGTPLVPNALGDSWEPRSSTDRQDYTRQVETEYQQIIRRQVDGGGPANYFWEVHDKSGNVYWYGGHPDLGGPDGYGEFSEIDGTPTIDRSAIVTDEHGNGVRWLLSAQRDIGVNQISYRYATATYVNEDGGWVRQDNCASSGDVVCARHTYLSSIDYTEASSRAPAADGDAAYRIVFGLESQVRPDAAVRADPVVDAMGGFVDVIVDRLARVDVYYGKPVVLPGLDADNNERRGPRQYDQLAMRYELNYTTGPFGKSLLSSISQIGHDAVTAATHNFAYHDRVGNGAGGYNGFAEPSNWNTGSDLPDRLLLDSQASIGVLGASESNSGEGHAYIGFNPIVGQKVGSFGGALQIGGGATEALAEWLDINGDGLPDKVYRESDGSGGELNDTSRDGPIRFRLSNAGPNGTTEFGPEQTVVGINKLSYEGNFGFEGSLQAFPGVTVAFGLGAEVSWGEAYFSDVNGDGLPDFVRRGNVFFNRLVDGVPHFEEGSTNTLVPISDTPATVAMPDQVRQIEAQLAAKNPLVDTVRRWTAPYAGTVSVNAPVTLEPRATASTDDGVRVAIQVGNTEVSAANLLTAGSQAFTSPIALQVGAGTNIYFRVGSVNNGGNDEVTWSPSITYTAIDGVDDLASVPTDVNGLSQTSFVAADDFTLSGRPDSLVMMPFKGTVRFTATIAKQPTSDEVRVQLLHNGAVVPGSNLTIAAADGSSHDVDVSFDVAAPVQSSDPAVVPTQDTVTVKLLSDSPIDLQAISWNPTLTYTSAFEADGVTPRPVVRGDGSPSIQITLNPEIEQYPSSNTTSISLPWVTPVPTMGDAAMTFNLGPQNQGGTAIVTVKDRSGVVAKTAVTIAPAVIPGTPISVVADLNALLQKDTEYWFDVNVRDAPLSDSLTMSSFALVTGNEDDPGVEVPAVLRWTGRQGIFPLAYRGWAVAGYNGDAERATQPIDPGAFVIDVNNLPSAPADPGFDDVGTSDPAQDRSFAYLPAVRMFTIPTQPEPLPTAVWVGTRANLSASAHSAVSSRLGADSNSVGASTDAGGGRAVNRVSITAPSAKLAFGIGPFGASFGISPSFGLVDYEDMNGDGYPDIITPNSVTYTTQRGGYLSSSRNPGELAVTNQDLTMSVGGGIDQGLVDIKANAKGRTNATTGSAAGKGSDADDSSGGLGVGVNVNVSWSSPNASGPSDSPAAGNVGNPTETYAEQLAETPDGPPSDTAPIQLGLADVNGDGLPDRVFTTPRGVFARYNLGYRFSDGAVQLSNGGFQSQESYAGGLSLGFSTPWGDFSGGVALNWNIDLSRYTWVDVNGDGILDQLHKINNSDPPTVRFGTGSGMLDPVVYGTMASSKIQASDAGQQMSLDRTTGIGGQADFTVAIGPLCLVACYIIINPGASYQNSVSSSEVGLQDVNGDGFADSVQTLDDNSLVVRQNRQADTNLLSTVTNPLGGTTTIGYTRTGNTVDSPDSVWTMTSVDVDDGRPGDGVDVRSTTFAYDGMKFDRLHRASLGFAKVVETEMDSGAGVRATTHSYRNDNVFNAGLETSTIVTDAQTGEYIHGLRQTWELRDVRGGADLSALTTVASLGYSIAPLMTKAVTEVGDGSPSDPPGQTSTTELTYNSLGDVIRQADLGEDDDPDDDVVADYLYSRCEYSSSQGCAGDIAHDRPSPLWDAGLCATWASLPVAFTVSNGKSGGDQVIYRSRDGRADVCDNASVTYLVEQIGDGQEAVTELQYDAWGSYDRIVYPLGSNGKRFAVRYVYDADSHANIAETTEYDLDPAAVESFLDTGLTAADSFIEGLRASATYDPRSGRIAKRTDPNGNVTSYAYDALGRIASSSSPRASDPAPLVTYEYRLSTSEAPTASAVAHHYDAFHPQDTIDTATFVDGTGREVQTQRDATLFQGATSSPVNGVVVSGATFIDALGRTVAEYNPTRSTKQFGVYEDAAPASIADPHTTTEYDLWDLPNVITEPGDRVTTIAYGYEAVDGSSPVVYTTTETGPSGRATVTYTDMRDVVRAIDDVPVGAARQRTVYRRDGMGQLLNVTDPNGNQTTHTYDKLGRRLSTSTPDGGLVQFGYDADGQQISQITPNLRTRNEKIEYRYELHRLTAIDYPGTDLDVTYTYGKMKAPGNGAGRAVRVEDGSRIQSSVFDAAGNVTRQDTTMKLHNWTPSADQSKFTWTTNWVFDGLGRLESMVYPDTERLTYGYDAGGQVNSIAGSEDGYKMVVTGTDAYGKPIYTQVPWTWEYKYLNDRQYDPFLRRVFDVAGNAVTTELSFDTNTQWLNRQLTISPNRDVKSNGAAYQEIQDLNYTYNLAGNPTAYSNALPAPVSNLFSGPVTQNYTYDPYGRIVSANGEWQATKTDRRRYDFSVTFDAKGNVVAKKQNDRINNGKKDLVQKDTTYSFSRTFAQPAPHQITNVAKDKYFYDASGNLLGLKDSKGKWIRQLTWDAAGRLATINDSSSSTTYRYDESGERSIERGPSGETASINPWVTVRNGTEIWKHFWAGNDRIGTQRDTGGTLETQQYFLHKDLQGNTNVVTDPLGNTFQHQEYFPTGEVWVAENSTVFRTPYQFGGGYTDEVRDLINFGDRWYDPIRELMYSPDPVLVDDLMAIVAEPSLRWAYAYAGSNAIGNIDPSGRQFTTAQAKAYINANMTDARRIVAADAQRQAQLVKAAPKYLPKGLVAMAVDIDKVERAQKKFDKIDDVAKPFVELNISTGDISLSPGLFKQFVVRKGNKAEPGVLTRKDPQPDIGAPPLQPSRKPPKPLPKPPIAGNEVAGDA